jgi:membrane protein DedA with SNARE-associated domain
MLLLAAATLVSEDLACVAAGLLVAQGAVGFLPAVIACLAGIVVGDIGLYGAGRLIGARALSLPPIRWVLSEARVAESAAWFERRGPLVILLTRFVPGTRLPTYFTSGLLRTGFLRFALYFLVAAALWTPLLVGVSSLVGRRVFDYFEVFRRNAPLGLAVTALVVWLVVKAIPVVASWRGRRLAIGFWRRWTRWEYWPWWLIYAPILGWIAWLGLRFRSPTLFTLANPGIDCGGFVGESKGDLLAQMPDEVLPTWERIEAGLTTEERSGRLHAFFGRDGVGLPIVLKPDAGERGRDVLVARRLEDAESYLVRHRGATLLQSYVSGSEFGVFYARRPGEPNGRVTSITAKILPAVTGDGASTIERLILCDERAVCQAPRFLADLGAAGRLEEVPAAGEEVRLGDLGTHWRGARFLDANHLLTGELETAIDRIARGVDGFFFGRFDLRVESDEALGAGHGIRVLELNGVTSEEAHMYDPRHGVLYAWRTLAAQWRSAFEIGAANRDRGLAPSGLRELVRSWRRYARTAREAAREAEVA